MGEVIQFISKSERERALLIRKARAIYDSIFPPQPDMAPVSHKSGGANPGLGDGVFT
jgi:hypothetical protein